MGKEFSMHKFGRNPDVDGAEDIWDAGGLYEFPLVAFETSIIGGSNDVVGSSGVHGVRIIGLDINGVDITEVATLTGAAPLVLANSYYRVNRAYILSTGGNDTNSWDINISHTGSATLSRISANEGQTLQAIYTLPANVNAHLQRIQINAARVGNKMDTSISIRFQTRENGAAWRTRDSGEVTNAMDFVRQYLNKDSIPIKGFTDIRARVTAVNTDNIAVSVCYELAGHRTS